MPERDSAGQKIRVLLVTLQNSEKETSMAGSVTVIPATRKGNVQKETREKLRVAAYCRVSTELEQQQGSFESQITYYTNRIRSHPDWVLAGIFSDEGRSGTGTRNRPGFRAMLAACREGTVDLILTRSVSRFARNTADCLRYTRELRDLGIPIRFEEESIDTGDTTGELFLTILASLAQNESRSISENTKWGIRTKFRQGLPLNPHQRLFGYDRDEAGNLIVNREQAAVVEQIFLEFLAGASAKMIADGLNDENIPKADGSVCWKSGTILRILKDEKYRGDLLLQKTFSADYLTHKTIPNNGELNQYYVLDDHEAIVSAELWDDVQYELRLRGKGGECFGFREFRRLTFTALRGRVFCGRCKSELQRTKTEDPPRWICECSSVDGRPSCVTSVSEDTLRRVFVRAWNRVVKDREALLPYWQSLRESEDPLVRYRGRLMMQLSRRGCIVIEVPELTRMVLDRMTVNSPEDVTVRFRDGTEREIRL